MVAVHGGWFSHLFFFIQTHLLAFFLVIFSFVPSWPEAASVLPYPVPISAFFAIFGHNLSGQGCAASRHEAGSGSTQWVQAAGTAQASSAEKRRNPETVKEFEGRMLTPFPQLGEITSHHVPSDSRSRWRDAVGKSDPNPEKSCTQDSLLLVKLKLDAGLLHGLCPGQMRKARVPGRGVGGPTAVGQEPWSTRSTWGT